MSVVEGIVRRLRRLFGQDAPNDDAFYRVSFAMDAEDLHLLALFGDKSTGFYVDVGAHHPRKYSNTFAFYDRGWRGINIDAMPGSMAAFRAARPRDINLELAISDSPKTLTFYEFDQPELNGFDADLANRRHGAVLPGRDPSTAFRIVNQREIATVTLASVLAQHVPKGTEIDFLSVDVEGLDHAVLASNDWSRFRPTAIVAEDSEAKTLADLATTRIGKLLTTNGYVPVCRTPLTTIYARADRLNFGDFHPRLVSGP
jgi:FkbM family methyltransferase